MLARVQVCIPRQCRLVVWLTACCSLPLLKREIPTSRLADNLFIKPTSSPTSMDMQTGNMFNMPAWHLTDVVHTRSYILGDEYLLTSPSYSTAPGKMTLNDPRAGKYLLTPAVITYNADMPGFLHSTLHIGSSNSDVCSLSVPPSSVYPQVAANRSLLPRQSPRYNRRSV